jgi:hypothetical protein
VIGKLSDDLHADRLVRIVKQSQEDVNARALIPGTGCVRGHG